MKVFAIFAMIGLAAFAQQVDQPAGQVSMSWEQFSALSGWDGEPGSFALPWAEAKELLGIEVQGIDTASLRLPWREFKTLLEWRSKQDGFGDSPVPYMIQSCDFVGELGEQSANFVATFKLHVFAEGWQSIPILPADVAVRETALPEGVHLQLQGNQYRLLSSQTGDLSVSITFSVAVREDGGAHALRIAKLPAGISTIDVNSPGEDVAVTIAGARSQTDGPQRVVALLAPADPIDLRWERAIPEVAAVPPKLYSETRSLVSVADGMLLGRTQVVYSILHTGTRIFSLTVPANCNVLDVVGASLRDWRVSEGVLHVQLAQEVLGSFQLDIQYESPLSASEAASVPLISALGVEREKGHIGIVALTNVEVANAEGSGAQPIDARDLPAEIAGMTSQPVLLAYRYTGAAPALRLAIQRHPDVPVLLTVVDRCHLTVMQTRDGRRITRALYSVRNNRNQFLRLRMPTDSTIWSVSVAGRATQPAQDTEGNVLLPLVRSGSGGQLEAFPIELVYVESGEPPVKGKGSAKIVLPQSSEPITHALLTLYVPEDGRYKDFEGTLRQVDNYSSFSSAGGQVFNASDVEVLQQAYVAQNASAIAVAGGNAVDVKLPLSGKVYRFEKILVMDGEQSVSYNYSGLE
ncbi:MAG: hypothetical protein ACI8W8_000331 [Rhodothermales bacterium]|jgi:hypothetical protein